MYEIEKPNIPPFFTLLYPLMWTTSFHKATSSLLLRHPVAFHVSSHRLSSIFLLSNLPIVKSSCCHSFRHSSSFINPPTSSILLSSFPPSSSTVAVLFRSVLFLFFCCSPLFVQGKTINNNNNNNNNPFSHVPVTCNLKAYLPCTLPYLPCITKHVSVIHPYIHNMTLHT